MMARLLRHSGSRFLTSFPLRRAVCAATLLGLLFTATPGRADKDSDAALALLKTMDGKTDLETAGLEPWYVKIDVQLFMLSPKPLDKSTPGEQGTIQEVWASPTMFHIVYDFPSYKASEGSNAGGFYRSGDLKETPLQIAMVRRQVVHPTPLPTELFDTRLEMRKQIFGADDMVCAVVGRPVTGNPFPPIGHFPAYCAKGGTSDLATTLNYGGEFITMLNSSKFQERTVPGAVVALVGRQTAALAKVSKLTQVSLHENDYATPAGAVELGTAPPLAISTAEAAKHLEHKTGVRLEDGLTTGKVAGNDFSARVRIGADGKVISAIPFGVSVQTMVNPCLTAIRGYVYRPWQVDGKPVEVETIVNIEL